MKVELTEGLGQTKLNFGAFLVAPFFLPGLFLSLAQLREARKKRGRPSLSGAESCKKSVAKNAASTQPLVSLTKQE